jgi:hypothetical protein
MRCMRQPLVYILYLKGKLLEAVKSDLQYMEIKKKLKQSILQQKIENF